MLNIYVLLSTTRPQRRSEPIGKWVMSELAKNKQIKAELIDLRDWDLPFFNEVKSMMSIKKEELSSDAVRKWGEKIAKADGYIIVTAEYNHGYPAVLKNALDYAYYEWHKKPVGFVAYGAAVGGVRAVEQLRQVAIELQMAPISEAVYIPLIRAAFDEKGNLKDEDSYNKRLDSMVEQLIWWTKSLKEARDKS